jgi:hypothetical protein
MKLSKYFIFAAAVMGMLLITGSIVAQQSELEDQSVAAVEPEVQWLWGEVVSIDAENNALLVKYLDYETDTEKQVAVGVDDKTVYEDIASLAEIRPQDNVSIDYITGAEGKLIAKNISIEKPEAAIETDSVVEGAAANNTVPPAPAP